MRGIAVVSQQVHRLSFDSSNAAIHAIDWGYGYDSLLVDLSRWQSSPYVELEQPGRSVQGRPLWVVTISDIPQPVVSRFRVTVHARTHPEEVESFYTTREMIRILIGDTPLADQLRSICVFNIMPMYNPDGVELGYARLNANGVNLEREWNRARPEPEVSTLKALFKTYMASESPVRLALNMHADHHTNSRYFVYHHENGTSVPYTEIERAFIGHVHKYWTEGISDWDGFVSWTSGTPPYYPESWFWFNYGQAVLALTYEEIRTNNAADYVKSASALLNGIYDYIESMSPVAYREPAAPVASVRLFQNYPNPFRGNTTITYDLPRPLVVSLAVYDVLGREVAVLVSGQQPAGRYRRSFESASLPSGTYLYRLQAGDLLETRMMTVVK